MLDASYKRPIIVVGTAIYRNPNIQIITAPKIPLSDYIFGRYDPKKIHVQHFINDVPIVGANPKRLFRNSGRFVLCFDN